MERPVGLTTEAPLQQQEAVLLAHALLARLADQVDARVLFIKGPTAVAVGARPDRPSSDVDVLVDPPSFDALRDALERCGWVHRTVDPWAHKGVSDVAFDHSAHFIHPHWPCDLDVHFNFPGFLGEPTTVFESLWSEHGAQLVAGRQVTTLSLCGHALVVALHALRDPERTASHNDLAFLRQSFTNAGPEWLAQLGRLAETTGSEVTARPLLEALGAPVPEPAPELMRRVNDWEFRRQSGETMGVMRLVQLRRAPWRERPAVLKRALFPPTDVLMQSQLTAEVRLRTLANSHLKRWLRIAKTLPAALGRASDL